MEKTNPDRSAAVQQITALTQNLSEALDSTNPQRIVNMQQNLTAAAEMIWAYVEHDPEISGKDKAVVRLLANGAIQELPQLVQDPANYPKIKRELRLLRTSLALLA